MITEKTHDLRPKILYILNGKKMEHGTKTKLRSNEIQIRDMNHPPLRHGNQNTEIRKLKHRNTIVFLEKNTKIVNRTR